MRYNTYINNKKAMEWGLNANQAALFDLLNQLSSWANPMIIGTEVFYYISRGKIIAEIPLFYTKDDTVYRHLKILENKGLINYKKVENKDVIKLTKKGKEWNLQEVEIRSDLNPTLGNQSEIYSDLNPTDNNTRIYNTEPPYGAKAPIPQEGGESGKTNSEMNSNFKQEQIPYEKLSFEQKLEGIKQTCTKAEWEAGKQVTCGIPAFITKWDEWEQHRKEKRQKLTPSTKAKQIKQLTAWHGQGHNADEIIEQSIMNGWTGLFVVKSEKQKGGYGDKMKGTMDTIDKVFADMERNGGLINPFQERPKPTNFIEGEVL
jgi:hypothetical protein